MSSPHTTIVIPTYNERENLRPLVERIAALCIPDYSILIVDDASPDGTGAIAEELACTYPVHVLHRFKKEGLGTAYVAGFEYALRQCPHHVSIYPHIRAIREKSANPCTCVIVQMDADGSHDPAEIPKMVALITSGSLRGRSRSNPTPYISAAGEIASSPRAPRNDLIVGSRRVPGGRTIGWGWHRRCMSASAQWFARHLLGLRTRDVTSGFRVWRADALRASLGAQNNESRIMNHGNNHAIISSGYAFQEEMLYRAERTGQRIIEHPITFRDRTRGCSKLGWRDILGFFRTCARLRREGSIPHPDGIVTWSRLPTAERRFALGIGIALILLTGLPYLYGLLRAPPGFTYTGIHALSGGDAHVYYSYIEQARDGAFAFRDLFTSEPSAAMTQLPWLAVGLFARALHLSAPLALHVVRLLLIIPYVMFLAVVIATIVRQSFAGWSAQRLRKIALLFTAFGGGIGGLFGAAFVMRAYDTSAYSAWPMDLWVPEAFTFLSIFQSPHFIISTWLLLSIYLASIRSAMTARVRWTIVAALAAALLAQFHPFYIPLIVAIVVAHAAARMVIARRWITNAATHALWTSLAMLPAFAYWWPVSRIDPIHVARAAQNLLLMPPFGYVLAGYGFLLPLAILGLIILLRSREYRQAPAAAFLATWTIVNGVMLWSPFAWQRRFVEGWSVALAILAAFGIAAIVVWLRRCLPARWFSIICTRGTAATLFVLLIAFTSIVNVSRDLTYYTMRSPVRDPRYMFYYPTAAIEAMRWLRAHAQKTDIALAVGLSANFIPGWAARPVYIGHAIETAHIEEKERVVLALLDPKITPNAQRAMLTRMGIRYIFVTTFEPPSTHLDRIARTLNLPRVFANDAVAIYEMK